MAVISRLILRLPHLLLAAYLGWLTGYFLPVVLIAAVLLLTTFLPRISIAAPSQLLVGIAASALVGFGVWLEPPATDRLSDIWAGVALATLLITLLRFLFREPWGGERATLLVGLTTLMALGNTTPGSFYLYAVAVFCVTALLTLELEDRGRASMPGKRSVSLGFGVLIASVLVALGMGSVLPRTHDIVQQFAIDTFNLNDFRQSGFNPRTKLGGLKSMLQSDRVVLRVYGEPTDHLRGIVYTQYRRGHWNAPLTQGEVMAVHPTLSSSAATEVRTILEDESTRFFTPLNAVRYAVPEETLEVDDLGIHHPGRGNKAGSIWFVRGRQHRVRAPTPEDLAVPEELQAKLQTLAKEWTADKRGTEQKLSALMRHLHNDFTYSLQFTRPARVDPVIDFLFQNRQGHCEYFASAMTLLARSLDIPARVAGGFRVTERNELTDYYVVRQKNAHAWVEAWLPANEARSGWTTFDPTPPGALAEQMRARTTGFAAWADLIRERLKRALDWILARTISDLLLVAALAILYLFRRTIFGWFRKDEVQEQADDGPRYRTPLACLNRLAEALAERGEVRATSEPLAFFATRIETSDKLSGRGSEAASIIRSYVALRYGQVGDEQALNRDVDRFLRG